MVELTGKDLADNAPGCQLNKTVDEFYMSNKLTENLTAVSDKVNARLVDLLVTPKHKC